MIQVLDKYGNTNNDDGRVLVFDKDGNIKRINSGGGGGGITHNVLIDCGTFLAPTENILIDCGNFI